MYKVKKGKQESYLKDDSELNNYLLQSSVENASLRPGEQVPAIGGQALETLVRQYHGVADTIQRLKRAIHPEVLECLLYCQPVTAEVLADDTRLRSWLEDLLARLNAENAAGLHFEGRVLRSAEGGAVHVRLQSVIHGATSHWNLSQDFFHSGEYAALRELGGKLQGLIQEGAVMNRGDKTREISNFKQGLLWLMEEARRGLHVQRYKGLGEMNPEQLWETTMDPECRRLLKVQIEDAVSADEVFTTLMGDQVEPRREFIEQNALSVANLDI